MNEQNTVYLANYVTLFLDVLGQKNVINNLVNIPEKESEEKEVIEILKESAGFVIMMRNMLGSFFRNAAKLSELGKQQSVAMKNILITLHEVKIIQKYFSDSFIFSVCLMEKGNNMVPMSGLYNTIYGACFTQFATLAIGKPLRGGIDVGLSIEIEENEIYGRSLSSAYALERDVANYPRIVVGKELYNMIYEFTNIDEKDSFTKLNKFLAKECMKLIFKDYDNNYALDYLSPSIKEHLRDIPKEVAELVNFKRIEEFVEMSLTKFENNSKLNHRYLHLRNYVSSRSPIWI